MGEAISVTTYRQEVTSTNILEVEVGTNSPQGGDAGSGGRTYFRLSDAASTAWRAIVTDRRGDKFIIDDLGSIELMLGGDTEADTLAEALQVAARVLKEQLQKNKDGLVRSQRDVEL